MCDHLRRSQLREEPELYAYFETVWEMRQIHEVPALPSQYVYLLVCCFQQSCPHPLCQAGKDEISMEWFPGGPQVDYIPLPILDPAHSWGSDSCDKCSDFCAGHFLKPEEALKSDATPMAQPPSTILMDLYQNLAGKDPSESMLERMSKDTLLAVSEVRMWLDHLKTVDTNRKRGAAKAADTRRRKRESRQITTASQESSTAAASDYYCGICGAEYGVSDEPEFWIGCDKCDAWFHGDCVSITPENEPNEFYCSSCV